MPGISRKEGSLLREKIQLKVGQIVLVIRDDDRLEPLIGTVKKASLDHGAIVYRVRIIGTERARKFNANQVYPVVGWVVGEVSKYHFVKADIRDPEPWLEESPSAAD